MDQSPAEVHLQYPTHDAKRSAYRLLSVTLVVAALVLVQPGRTTSAAPSAPTKPAAPSPSPLAKASLDGLAFRSIGPAVTGGRVVALAVNPRDHSEYFVAAGHGALWKTTNAGVTFTPVFDEQSTFSIGAVTLDPSDPHVVWVGTSSLLTSCSKPPYGPAKEYFVIERTGTQMNIRPKSTQLIAPNNAQTH